MSSTTRCHQILKNIGLGIFKDLIPNEQVEDLIGQWYPQMRRRALTVGSVMGLLIVAQLERVTGAVDELLRRTWSRIRTRYGAASVAQPVTRQAFSKRLRVLPWQIFRGLLGVLFSAYAQVVRPGEGLYQNIYTVQAIDGSVVDVAARLMKAWAGLPGREGKRTRKAQARVHAMFNVSLGAPTMVTVTGARRSERRQARKMLLEAIKQGPTIIVTDLGYFAFDFFAGIMKADGWFVARLRSGIRHRKVKRLGRRDFLVRLGITAKGQTQVVVRLVGVRERHEIYWYLTNLLPRHGIRPKDVRVIYRKRWLVELFFKSWKHALRGAKFFSYSTNGIKIQVYASICAYLLCRLVMARAAQKYGFRLEAMGFDRAASVVRCWMYEHWDHLWRLRPQRRYLEGLIDSVAILAGIVPNSKGRKIAKKRLA